MKRPSELCIAIVIAIGCHAIHPGHAFADPQDTKPAADSGASHQSQNKLPEPYLITISEYRLKGVNPSDLTADNIVSAIKAEKATPIETVMLSAIADLESMVQFGRSVTVTTGRITNRDVTSRQTQQREIGTIVRVTASPTGQQVGLTLSFESSRLIGEGSDDSPPDIVTTSINTTQLFDFGQPTMIGASTAGETSYVFLTISRR